MASGHLFKTGSNQALVDLVDLSTTLSASITDMKADVVVNAQPINLYPEFVRTLDGKRKLGGMVNQVITILYMTLADVATLNTAYADAAVTYKSPLESARYNCTFNRITPGDFSYDEQSGLVQNCQIQLTDLVAVV